MEDICQNIQEQMPEFIGGTLSAERTAELQQHVDSCPACSEYLKALQADDKLLGDFAQAMQQVVNRLEKNVMDTLSRTASSKPVSPKSIWRIIINSKAAKLAAAAVLLIVVGYAAGRLSAPRPLDAEELRVLENSLKLSLEPSIRQDVVEELNRDWQLALARNYVQLKGELDQRFRRDLNEFAVQTLAASSTVTNQLLRELIESISAAQMQERRGIAAALEQMELNRLRDNAQLKSDLASFAVQTSDEVRRTKEDMAQLLINTRPDRPVPDVSENLKTSNERSKK
jgi:hypothetical protein